MLRRTFFCLLWLGLAAFGPAGSAWPQQLADPENLPENSTGQGDSGPRTPLGTVQGFMRAAELGDYQLASTFLDLRYLPEAVADIDGQRLAEQLYIVISRELHIDFGALSTSPEGVADDGLPSYRDELGVNVTTVFASLGLGGVAIVLVLQKPMEDILGAITLYTQQPVKVGQFCTSGSITGTIEEISLRSTRVRKIDNSVVIIPNSIFATASIQNVSARQHILHRQTVRLSLGTEASRIRLVLEKLREMLTSNENVVADIWRVRLVEFGQFSLNIEVFAHIATTDWVAFLAIAEELNLGTIQVLEETGVRLAIPARSDVV